MKIMIKVLACFIVIASLQAATFAQIGYSITDNDQDVTNFAQQLYRINVANGETTYLGDLSIDRNGDGVLNDSTAPVTGERLQREYEGLASIGAVLYGVPEYAGLQGVGQNCNTGNDPISGLAVDLRTFRYNGPRQTVPTPANRLPAPVANPNTSVNSVVGPQIGETCIQFGTESALGYNAVDGYLYSIASDDLIPLPAIRSQLNRIDPTTGLAVATFNITNPGFVAGQPNGDFNPYLDGLTILPNGTAYGTEVRFDVDPNAGDADTRDAGGLYQIDLTNGNSTLVKYLLPAQLGRDTGLGNSSNGTLYILNERGIIYRTTASPTSGLATVNMRTTGATSGAGGGAAGLRIEGCRGVQAANEFNQTTLVTGSCGDFEGFDIPVVVLQ